VVDSYVKTSIFYCFDTIGCSGANGHFVVNGPLAVAPSMVTSSGTLTSLSDSAVMSYAGFAIANYGTFGVFSTGTLTGGDTSKIYATDALAQVNEKLTVVDAAKTGQPGTLFPAVKVNGSMTGSARANIVLLDASGISGESVVINGPTTVHFQPLTFVFGTPFDMTFQFFATIGKSGVSSFTGTGDFGHTATLTGLGVLDQNSNPDLNVTFISGSGTEYTPNGVVPEPSSWVMFVGAAAAAAARRRYS
jgi:hypothetical protein